jgi:hypothetical protein
LEVECGVLLCREEVTGDPEVIRFEKDSLQPNVETLHGPEVGFEEIATDLLQARFWITSGLQTI